MAIPDRDVTALIRSTAMAPPGSKVSVERDVVLELLEELMRQRSLLRRLGDDLRTVARTGSTGPPR